MNEYKITIAANYEKTISVYADTVEQAAEKAKIVLFDTDLIHFTDDDFVCGEVDIDDADENGCAENEAEDECEEWDDCSACPYFCPMCGECMYEDEE